MNKQSLQELLKNNAYPGRGIVLGNSQDGKYAIAIYFIMGRSVNSRNRIFVEEVDGISTKAFDESKVVDPSLIIYHPVRELEQQLIVTNGDQTDTIKEGLLAGKCFTGSLKSREFEPDAPNYTPRISGLLNFDGTYELSILKSIDEAGSDCARYTFAYPAYNGLGHFLHTYETDGNPLPSFLGEPREVNMEDDMDSFTEDVWNSLNEDNKISLYVCYIDKETGEKRVKIMNKNGGENHE